MVAPGRAVVFIPSIPSIQTLVSRDFDITVDGDSQ